jgi:hypothetical protein
MGFMPHNCRRPQSHHKKTPRAAKQQTTMSNLEEAHANDDTDENDQYFESTWTDDVETGIVVTWPGAKNPLEISTILEEDELAPLFHGTQWAGTRVWRAAILAIHYLNQEFQDSKLAKNSRLLELGCGLGVPGMVLHQLFPELEVVLTDQDTLVAQLQQNARVNFPDDNKIQAHALSWSREGVATLLDQVVGVGGGSSSGFDICLNCDCVYEPLYGEESWKALADTLAELASRNPSCLFITSVERRTADAVEKFLERLERSPHISKVELVLVNEDDVHHKIEIYVARGIGP